MVDSMTNMYVYIPYIHLYISYPIYVYKDIYMLSYT